MSTHGEGPLANSISLYLAHKRALGKRLEKTEPTLRLLDNHLAEQGIGDLSQITAAHLEGFLNSRPRRAQLQRAARNGAEAIRLARTPGEARSTPFAMFTAPRAAGASAIPL